MSKLSDIFALSQTITLAARAEALRWGHPQIEVEHVFLALVANDGASGRLLRNRGVTLTRARDAVSAVHAATVAELGVTPPPQGIRAVGNPADTEVDWSPAAMQLLREPGDGGSDLPVLLALLDTPGGFVAEVFRTLDVDTQGLRTDARAASDQPSPAAEPGLDERAWRSVTASSFATAEPDAVFALVADPLRRPEWDSITESVTPIGPDTWELRARNPRTRKPLGRRNVTSRTQRTDLVPGQAVEYETTWPRFRGSATFRLRITLAEAPGGTRVVLRLASARRHGWRAKLNLIPTAVKRFVLRQMLIAMAASIARVASEAADASSRPS